MKKLLVLQFRPETSVSDDEYGSFLRYGGLDKEEVERIRGEFGLPEISLEKYSAVLIGGSPYTVSDDERDKTNEQIKVEKQLFELMKEIYERDFPFLGNCYGHGVMVAGMFDLMSKEKYSENVGAVEVTLTKEGKRDKLLKGIKDPFYAFVGHKEACQEVPEGATLLASSKTCPVQMLRIKENVYTTQFHAELDYEGFAIRIDYYKHKGYFPPEDAEKLKEEAKKHKVVEPMKILKNFVNIYHNGTRPL